MLSQKLKNKLKLILEVDFMNGVSEGCGKTSGSGIWGHFIWRGKVKECVAKTILTEHG